MRQLVWLRASVVAAVALAIFVAAACGDDDDGDATAGPTDRPQVSFTGTPAVTPSTGGTAGGPEPVLLGPAARYAADEEDLGGYYRASSTDTLVLNGELFAQVGPFVNSKEGQERSKGWGYEEGYLVGYDPEGLLSSVVRGNYYVTVQTHRFATVAGAAAAYQQFVKFYSGTSGVEEQPAPPLGNESSGWRAIGDKLAPSDIDAVYHRFVFRRGNLIGQVETLGGLPFMTIDQAREIALLMDERALGERPAPIPTPASVPGQPAPPETPTPR